MNTEILSVAAIVTAIELVKRLLLGSADALDELSRRRPLKRHRDLLEAAGADSRVRKMLETERDSELFRQVFGKSASLRIEAEVMELRALGDISTRELQHLLRFMPYDAPGLTAESARSSAIWHLRAAGAQSLLVGVVVVTSAWGAWSSPTSVALRFFLPVLIVSGLGLLVFLREAGHAYLARQAIDRLREMRCVPSAKESFVPAND